MPPSTRRLCNSFRFTAGRVRRCGAVGRGRQSAFACQTQARTWRGSPPCFFSSERTGTAFDCPCKAGYKSAVANALRARIAVPGDEPMRPSFDADTRRFGLGRLRKNACAAQIAQRTGRILSPMRRKKAEPLSKLPPRVPHPPRMAGYA